MADAAHIREVQRRARVMRHHIVNMIGYGADKVGHLGGSNSCAEIVASLYFYKMRGAIDDPCRDRFLLSKGHAALVQYAALAEAGVIDVADLGKVKTLHSPLQGHPDRTKTPGVEANTGSLGQGLSIGVGIALGQRMDRLDARTYVLMGDGEISEGQIWEAALCAAAYRLSNLVGILDQNRYQATGSVKERLDTGDLGAKFTAFGWRVIELNGHSAREVCDALDEADQTQNQPTLLLCHTVKGKGVCFAENTAAFHNAGLTEQQFHQAHEDIDRYSEEG